MDVARVAKTAETWAERARAVGAVTATGREHGERDGGVGAMVYRVDSVQAGATCDVRAMGSGSLAGCAFPRPTLRADGVISFRVRIEGQDAPGVPDGAPPPACIPRVRPITPRLLCRASGSRSLLFVWSWGV